METELLIAQGNTAREQHNPGLALQCYARAFVQNPDHPGAFNNYGNVMREMGFPNRAQPFLEHALRLDPSNELAKFNLAVCYLLQGDYIKGWPAYEDRWNFEHLKGTLPELPFPRWKGEELQGKTILVIGEQGLGDTIQFARFTNNLRKQGANTILAVHDSMTSLFNESTTNLSCQVKCDYWTTIMSIPGILNISLDQLNSPLQYITANPSLIAEWQQLLGIKNKIRVGFSWSGRRDTWINQHKSVPFDHIVEMIKANQQYSWINLQIDASESEATILKDLGCQIYPGTISNMADTAALVACMDIVVSVDTAVSHLSAAMGKTTWIMLNHFATDWRWLTNRADSPWYPTARLFRQPSIDNWGPVLYQISHHLKNFKI